MTAWDIYPSSVSGVLQRCGKAAKDLGEAGQKVQGDLQKAAGSAGTVSGVYCGATPPSGPVSDALGDFFGKWERDVVYIAKRTEASFKGARLATEAYIEGDLKMAAQKQGDALKEPEIKPEDLSSGKSQGNSSGGGK
ncbi:DUF6507 family protein [Streptomyces gamaensis]|uniref:DUF6507 family protein n=1 Tax=Streptomyces gamaensis TaxID=1763542 RepID=A0ABW0YYN9_9ACTN